MQENTPQNNMPPMGDLPQMTPVNPSPLPQNKSSIGGIIGTIIVIAVIILGGLYFWGKRIDEAKMNKELVESQETASSTLNQNNDDMEANSIRSVNSNDDLDSIEADLQTTNLNDLDAELEAELE